MAAGVNIVELAASTPTYSYTVPAGSLLVGWEVRSSDSSQSVSLGTTALGSELGGPVDLSALQVWASKGINLTSFSSNDIYFSGLEGLNSIRLWLLQSA